MSPHSRSLTALVCALTLVAACSSSDDVEAGGSTSTTDAPSTSASTSSPTTTVADGPSRAPARPSPGCATADAAAAHEEKHELEIQGEARYYLVTAPAAGDEPTPLVFDFHGLMEGAAIHAGMTQFSALAESEGFTVVFPHGTGSPVRWDADPRRADNKDLEYFDTVLEEVAASRCVDLARVYSTGLSYGAIMTSLLLCTRADVLAAAAPVDGIQLPDPCEPSRPVPILAYHGTADPLLKFNGGFGGAVSGLLKGEMEGGATTTTAESVPYDLDGEGYPATVASWAERNGCAPAPTDTPLTETVVRRVYDCPEGADVEFVVVIDGGHAWPGSDFSKSIEKIVGPTTFDIDATEDIWAFFQRFALAT